MLSDPNRREFLHLSASGALLSALACKADPAPDNAVGEWRNRRPGMSYRRLGRTDFMISEIICGGNTISPTNYDHVITAFELGLNYFDTAIQYGRGKSEAGYAQALKAVGRDNVFLTSKASPWLDDRNDALQKVYESLPDSEKKKIDDAVREKIEERHALDEDYLCNYFDSQRAQVEKSVRANLVEERFGDKVQRPKKLKQAMIDHVEDSLRRLETDHLDIVMCPHAASTYAETQSHELFEGFEQLKQAGKVRHLGVSAHNDPAAVLEGAVDSGVYSAAMVAYNIVNKDYLQSALTKASKADLGVIAMKVARPVNHGRNNGKPNDPRRVAMIEQHNPTEGLHVAQKCYLWALEDYRIAACNSEMINLELVEQNVPLAFKKSLGA